MTQLEAIIMSAIGGAGTALVAARYLVPDRS
jgi:hypothetical protein